MLNQKGGVGKTTTTVNTAAALATMGQRVIAIDLDPQAHLTIHLGIEPQELKTGSYEVLTQTAGFEESLMMVRPNLWALPANINLVGAETELVNVVGREIILREAMAASADRFDFCLIDCAPSLGLLSLNALAAAEEVLIPLQPHFLALQGFGKLLQTVDLVSKRINRDLKVTGVLLCMFDTRASLPNEVRADIMRFLENARGSATAWADAQLVPTFIRRNIKLAEAPSYGRTIFEYDPACNGAEDYANVARFFLGLEPDAEPLAEQSDDSRSVEETDDEPHPVGANDRSPSLAEDSAESIPAETQDVASLPPSEAEANPEPGETNETVPSAARDLEPAPVIEHEFVVEGKIEAAPVGPNDNIEDTETSGDIPLPPAAQAEPSEQTQEAASPPEDEPPKAQPDGAAPIEIREISPPAPRRYSPPPLQRYPIGPADRDQSQGDAPDSPDTPVPDESA